jgi:hypothetical protein
MCIRLTQLVDITVVVMVVVAMEDTAVVVMVAEAMEATAAVVMVVVAMEATAAAEDKVLAVYTLKSLARLMLSKGFFYRNDAKINDSK